MGSGAYHSRDCPEQYWNVVEVIISEETTIVDAVATGELDRDDLDTFSDYVAASDRDLDPGLVHLIKIVTTLLEECDG